MIPGSFLEPKIKFRRSDLWNTVPYSKLNMKMLIWGSPCPPPLSVWPSDASRGPKVATPTKITLFTRSPAHPLTRSLAHPFTRSPVHPFTRSPAHPFTRSPVHLFTCSPVHSFTRSPVHLFTRSPVHSFTRWCRCNRARKLANRQALCRNHVWTISQERKLFHFHARAGRPRSQSVSPQSGLE